MPPTPSKFTEYLVLVQTGDGIWTGTRHRQRVIPVGSQVEGAG